LFLTVSPTAIVRRFEIRFLTAIGDITHVVAGDLIATDGDAFQPA
jgi:hypothetical protein